MYQSNKTESSIVRKNAYGILSRMGLCSLALFCGFSTSVFADDSNEANETNKEKKVLDLESNTEQSNATQDSGENTTTGGGGVNTLRISPIVTSATGFEQELREAPASMSIITGKSLQDRPVRDLGEAVGLLPGVSIDSGATNFGGYSISIRGMPTSYTLLMIDGKRQDGSSEVVPNVSYSTASFMPPIAAIERIEVIRGPASTIYGSDAIGGVVNVILKKSFDKWSSNILLNSTLQEQSLFGHSVGISAYTGGPLDSAKKWSLQIRARDTYQFAPRTLTIPVPTTTGNLTLTGNSALIGGGKNNQYDTGIRLAYNPSNKNYVYLDVEHGGQWFDPNVFENSYFLRNNSIIRHQGHYGKNGSIRTDTSIQYNNMYNETRSRMTNDAVFEHRTAFPIWRMRFNVGLQYVYNSISALNGTVFGGDVGNFIDRHNFSLYVEDEWAIIDSLLLTVGVRFNINSNFGFNASPRGYLVWNAYEGDYGDFTLKGGVSTGYKVPNITLIVQGWGSSTGRGAVHIYGNPDLKPESSINYELGALYDTDYTQLSLTGFYTQFYDKITSTGTLAEGTEMPGGLTCVGGTAMGNYQITPGCQYSYNIDTAQSYGIELYGQLKPISVGVGEIGFDLSYTWNKNQSTSGSSKGLPLVGIPEHTLNASLNYTWNDLGIYLRGEFRAKQAKSISTISTEDGWTSWLNANPGVSRYYKPYFLLHLGANYNITKGLKVQFGIYNLLNHNFVDYYLPNNANGTISTTPLNNYSAIREGRRYYLAVSYDF